jgi:hypothetical protein
MQTSLEPRCFSFDLRLAPTAMAFGVAWLLIGTLWPGTPVVTAMALVTFGATAALVARMRRSSHGIPMLAAHAFVYGALYAIFVGAELHAANAASGPRLSWLVLVDVALSVVPMLAAANVIWTALRSEPAGGT